MIFDQMLFVFIRVITGQPSERKSDGRYNLLLEIFFIVLNKAFFVLFYFLKAFCVFNVTPFLFLFAVASVYSAGSDGTVTIETSCYCVSVVCDIGM